MCIRRHQTLAASIQPVLAAQTCWFFARSTASVSLSCWATASQPLKCCPFSRPINGGQDCPGVNFEYQLCNTEECQKHFEDFRAQQCQQRNSHFEYQNTKHHWLPHEHPDCEQTPLFILLCRWSLCILALLTPSPCPLEFTVVTQEEGYLQRQVIPGSQESG